MSAATTTRPRPIVLRPATAADARAIHGLIAANTVAGHLLPRSLAEVTLRAARFVVATRGRKVVGCAELAPLSTRLAEVRSLAVHESVRHQGIGTQLVTALRQRAQSAEYQQLCVLTHAPEYFANLGFSMVPHLWVQEKVFTDCVTCPRFRACGQFAMVLPLDLAVEPGDEGDDDHPPTGDRPATLTLQVA